MSQDLKTIQFGINLVRENLSNATARRWFAHAHDEDVNGDLSCYFCAGDIGFWVSKDGKVVADETTCSGELPSRKILDACIRAAKKYLG
jgi:hypothetical protein